MLLGLMIKAKTWVCSPMFFAYFLFWKQSECKRCWSETRQKLQLTNWGLNILFCRYQSEALDSMAFFTAAPEMASDLGAFVTGNTPVGLTVNSTNRSVNVNETTSQFFPQIKPTIFPRIQVYIYVVLASVGVLNNSMTLGVFHRMPAKPLYTYLKGLALVDLMFVFSVGVSTVYMWNSYTTDYTFCFIMCHIVMQLMWVSAKASTSITTLVAVERAVGVLFPFLMIRLNSSTSRVRYALVAVAIVTLASQIGTILMLPPTPYGDNFFCFWSSAFFTPLGQTLVLLNACVFEYAMPLLLLITNICLIVQLRVARTARRKLQADGKQIMKSSTDHHITALLISASLLSLVSNTPATLIRLLKVPGNIYGDIRLFADFFFVFERTANFYIYALMIKDFRRIAKALLCCKPATGSSPDTIVTGSEGVVSYKCTASDRHVPSILDEISLADRLSATEATVKTTKGASQNIT